MVSTATTTMSHKRKRPLHTCGVSFSEITLKAYKKAKEFNRQSNSVTNNSAKLVASLLVMAIHCRILAILSFIDDGVLALESVVEATCPSLKHIFDKINELVLVVETLPGKFDDAVNKFPEAICRVLILYWVPALAISWLSSLMSMLIDCQSGNVKENEVMNTIDIKCDEISNAEFAASKEVEGNRFASESNLAGDSECDTTEKTDAVSPEFTDKDALQMWSKEEELKDSKTNLETGKIGSGKVEKMEVSSSTNDSDLILELFESAWLRNRKDKERLRSRHFCYQW